MADCPTIKIEKWEGINNKVDPTRLTHEWLQTADNYDVRDDQHLHRRPGYALALADVIEIYGSRDEERLYGIDNAYQLWQLDLQIDGALVKFANLGIVGPGPYHWTEAEKQIFLLAAGAAWTIVPGDERLLPWGIPVPGKPALSVDDGSLPAGRYEVVCTWLREDDYQEGGAPQSALIEVPAGSAIQARFEPAPAGHITLVYASPPDGQQLYRVASVVAGVGESAVDGDPNEWAIPLKSQFFDGPPLGATGPIEFYDGRVWVAYHDSGNDFTRVFGSVDLDYHWFAYDDPLTIIDVPGRVTILAGMLEGALIGTDRAIYELLPGESAGYTLKPVATYGAVAGSLDWLPNDRAIFWTERGVCSALPFQELTEPRLSVVPGTVAAGLYRELQGSRHYLAVPNSGGVDHNRFAPTIEPVLNPQNVVR